MLEGIMILAGAVVVLCLLVAVWDGNRFITVKYEIVSDKIAKPCRFILLSDQHNKTYGKENEKLIGQIESLSPDAVLVAGDMLTAVKGQPFDNALSLMQRLAAKYPIYYGMGNHEYRLELYPEQYGDAYEKYVAGLKAAGIDPLINQNTDLPVYNIAICGSQIGREYYRRFRKYPMKADYLPKILGEPRTDACQILIAHNPLYFEEYAAWGADVVVSGHVHGGIMRLPVLGGVLSPNLSLFPKYDGGRFELGKAVMILSRGIGTHTIPLRIFNPAELVVLDFKKV